MELSARFGAGDKRRELCGLFQMFISIEVRPRFAEPIYIDGSFVTDKGDPSDVDVVLDLRNASDGRQSCGLLFMVRNRACFSARYRVDFWVNVAGGNDFIEFFQYVGPKVAHKGLSANDVKGILRVDDE